VLDLLCLALAYQLCFSALDGEHFRVIMILSVWVLRIIKILLFGFTPVA
jgi:hypothetical protein